MIPAPDTKYFFCQNLKEFCALLEVMKGSKSILEIGSRFGESLRWFAANCPHGSRIVTVDIGQCPDMPDIKTCEWWDDVCNELRPNYDLHQIYGDSHAKETIEKITALGPYDFVFIDGDHSYDGCSRDWENFGHLGKIVAFHDTVTIRDVRDVFLMASGDKRKQEFYEPTGFGIGVLWNG